MAGTCPSARAGVPGGPSGLGLEDMQPVTVCEGRVCRVCVAPRELCPSMPFVRASSADK